MDIQKPERSADGSKLRDLMIQLTCNNHSAKNRELGAIVPVRGSGSDGKRSVERCADNTIDCIISLLLGQHDQ